MADTIHVRGEGGTVFEMDLPLPESIEQRLKAGAIVQVNADGSHLAIPDGEAPAGRPSKAASQVAWAEYAVSQGADPDDVADLSRADLIELYGQD